MSQITSSIASIVIPKIISMTPDVVKRMEITKNYLEKNLNVKNHFLIMFCLKKKIFILKNLVQKNKWFL